ncbi:MAG TPA: SDR family oxidoreductase [Bacilli bacterium]|nr:SDR family oxidoreductase [Bacilli bacterium]
MARQLEGLTAIVTGASKGIGREIVRKLLLQGMNVVAVARGELGLERLQEEMGAGKQLLAVACDIRDALEVERLFEVATDEFGRIEVLINNAGVGTFGSIEDTDLADVDDMVDTNLKAMYYCCKTAFTHMKKRGGGQLVNIAAVLGLEAIAQAAAFCMTKFGVIGLSESLRREGQSHGIRVSVVAPGLTQTDFGDRPATDKPDGLKPESVAEAVWGLLTQNEEVKGATSVLRHEERD